LSNNNCLSANCQLSGKDDTLQDASAVITIPTSPSSPQNVRCEVDIDKEGTQFPGTPDQDENMDKSTSRLMIFPTGQAEVEDSNELDASTECEPTSGLTVTAIPTSPFSPECCEIGIDKEGTQSAGTPDQDENAWQLMQLLASQPVSSISHLLAPPTNSAGTSTISASSVPAGVTNPAEALTISTSSVPAGSTTPASIVTATYASIVTATSASLMPATSVFSTSAPIVPPTLASIIPATSPALKPPAPIIQTTLLAMPSIPAIALPQMTTQQVPALENTTTPPILDTHLATLLQQYLQQALPRQQPAVQPPCPAQAMQRATTINNLSPASVQGITTPNML